MTHFSSSSTLDFRDTDWAAIFLENEEGDRSVTIGNVLFKQFFGIKAAEIDLDGKIWVDDTFSDGYREQSKILLEGENVNFFSRADIHAGFTLIQANKDITMDEGAKITSTQRFSCNTNKASNELFQCIRRNSLSDTFTLDEYMDVFHEQFPSLIRERAINRFNDTLTYILRNYTVFMLSFNDIKMDGAKIEAPRIGICSNTLTMDRAQITASEHGCESDDGFGKGKKFEECGASGASHGGNGGHGGLESLDRSKHEQCKHNVPGSYYSGDTVKYEGSGGASGEQGGKLGGNGGGIVMINTLVTTELNESRIDANGGDALESG